MTDLPLAILRQSEDGFMDQLVARAAGTETAWLEARFPRSFVDVNREPYELDPAMFSDPLPSYINHRSPRVCAGLGTVALFAGSQRRIYRNKLRFDDVIGRINTYYRPYHAALRDLLQTAVGKHGYAVLLDCHSMPSTRLNNGGAREELCDIVLGDNYCTACAPAVTTLAEQLFQKYGYSTARNAPYAGGFVTQHYGKPRSGVHVLQIEINRKLYMDEIAHLTRPGWEQIGDLLGILSAAITSLPLEPDSLRRNQSRADPRP
jgi:N-formylglutamate amidohydrolase